MTGKNDIDDNGVIILKQLKSLDARLYSEILELQIKTDDSIIEEVKKSPLTEEEQVDLYTRFQQYFARLEALLTEVREEVVGVMIDLVSENKSNFKPTSVKDGIFFESSESGNA